MILHYMKTSQRSHEFSWAFFFQKLGTSYGSPGGVFQETAITIGVARVLIKVGIKIQLEFVNLHGIELKVGWDVM